MPLAVLERQNRQMDRGEVSFMPRKPKAQKLERTFVVNGKNICVTFFPPKGRRRSWYVYWNGLPNQVSTKASTFEGAVQVIHKHLIGETAPQELSLMSDVEFDAIQLRHFERIQAKPETVQSCFEALAAFRKITGVTPISAATAEDCSRFQDSAVHLPRNWRVPKSNASRNKHLAEESPSLLSRQTIKKWVRALAACFNRANSRAGKKCVRNVVPPEKLLLKNPWDEVAGIVDKNPVAKRQLTPDELLSVLDYFEKSFPLIPVAAAAIKVFIWSYARRREVSGLTWDRLRLIDGEIHFDVVGKWGVQKWFRIPCNLFQELETNRLQGSPFVFGSYVNQLVRHHATMPNSRSLSIIRDEFTPENFGEWLYQRMVDWSKSQPGGAASIHDFRKTSLQFAVNGEIINRQVAADARVNVGVMTTHYTSELAAQLREKSNRSFERIARSLPESVLLRFGYTPHPLDDLKLQLEAAIRNQEWEKVAQISQALANRNQAG
jgi:integrase